MSWCFPGYPPFNEPCLAPEEGKQVPEENNKQLQLTQVAGPNWVRCGILARADSQDPGASNATTGLANASFLSASGKQIGNSLHLHYTFLCSSQYIFLPQGYINYARGDLSPWEIIQNITWIHSIITFPRDGRVSDFPSWDQGHSTRDQGICLIMNEVNTQLWDLLVYMAHHPNLLTWWKVGINSWDTARTPSWWHSAGTSTPGIYFGFYTVPKHFNYTEAETGG